MSGSGASAELFSPQYWRLYISLPDGGAETYEILFQMTYHSESISGDQALIPRSGRDQKYAV